MKKSLFYTLLLSSLVYFGCEDDEVNYDIEKPKAEIDNSVLTTVHTKGGDLVIKAALSDNTELKKVEIVKTDWNVNDAVEISGKNYQLTHKVSIPTNADLSAPNKVQLNVYDKIGNKTSIEIPVNFGEDTEAPQVFSIASPANGEQVTVGQSFLLDAELSDNVGIAKVDVYIDGINYHQQFLGGNETSFRVYKTINVPMNTTPGIHEVRFVMEDIYGNKIEDSQVQFEAIAIPAPENLYLVGGSTPAGWTPANALQFKKINNASFELYTYLTVAGDGFKFLEVKDWAGDWGKDPNNANQIVQEGEQNVTITEDGYYKIVVDFSTLTYSATPMQWGVTGSATPNGWPSETVPDHDLTYDSATRTLKVTLALTVGDLKFRANDGWDDNFGDDGGDGSLEPGGENIKVTEAGNYLVELILDPVNGYTYKLTKQ